MSAPGEALRREERLILAWIRHVTAEKQARLRAIRRELKGVSAAKPSKRRKAVSGVGGWRGMGCGQRNDSFVQ